MTCPACQSDLGGNPIPEEHLDTYGGETHYSRQIGIEVRGVYDGVLIWQCPDCGHMWPRFPESDWRYAKAAELIAQREENK